MMCDACVLVLLVFGSKFVFLVIYSMCLPLSVCYDKDVTMQMKDKGFLLNVQCS